MDNIMSMQQKNFIRVLTTVWFAVWRKYLKHPIINSQTYILLEL
jgi:hypothetical protein